MPIPTTSIHYKRHENFISFQTYLQANPGKELVDYMADYFVTHEKAIENLEALASRGDGSRLLDKLPSDFFGINFASEFQEIMQIIDQDLQAEGVQMHELQMLDDPEAAMLKSNSLKLKAFHAHLFNRVRTIYAQLYGIDGQLKEPVKSLLAKNYTPQMDLNHFKATLFTAFITAYSQAVTEIFTSKTEELEADEKFLYTQFFTAAIWNPTDLVARSFKAFKPDVLLANLAKFNETLEEDIAFLKSEMTSVEGQDKEQLENTINHLEEKLKINQALVAEKAFLPPWYVQEQEETRQAHLKNKLTQLNTVLTEISQDINQRLEQEEKLIEKNMHRSFFTAHVKPSVEEKKVLLSIAKEVIDSRSEAVAGLINSSKPITYEDINAHISTIKTALQAQLTEHTLAQKYPNFLKKILIIIVAKFNDLSKEPLFAPIKQLGIASLNKLEQLDAQNSQLDNLKSITKTTMTSGG